MAAAVTLIRSSVDFSCSSVSLGVVAEPALSRVITAGLQIAGFASNSGGESGGHLGLSTVLSLAIINILHVIIGEQTPIYLSASSARKGSRSISPLFSTGGPN